MKGKVGHSYYDQDGSSYYYNDLGVTTEPGVPPSSVSRLQWPERTVLVAECPAFYLGEGQDDSWRTSEPRWSFHERGGRPPLPGGAVTTNAFEARNLAVMYDGHVEYMHMQSFEMRRERIDWKFGSVQSVNFPRWTGGY